MTVVVDEVTSHVAASMYVLYVSLLCNNNIHLLPHPTLTRKVDHFGTWNGKGYIECYFPRNVVHQGRLLWKLVKNEI